MMNTTIRQFIVQSLLASTVLSMLVAASTACQEPSISLFEKLDSVGVQLPGEMLVPVPAPSFASADSQPQRSAILDELSGKLGWKAFSRKSAVAPVLIRVQYVKNDADERVGHSIHNAFIAYAALDTLRDKDLMAAMFGRPNKSQDGKSAMVEDLRDDELEILGVQEFDGGQEGYLKLKLPLLNKVIVRGIVHLQKREGANWFQMVWEVDPRFTLGSAEATDNIPLDLQNSWTKLVPNRFGKQQETEPVAYTGCGGYVCVYETGRAPDQLLIESRMVLHEPKEWFAASNFLRSKIPLSLQESARSFRRKLMKK